ncbi:MAG: YqaA family protein [Mizugakiibacter sp.]|uniref:YqaA family protein n=1 Tax=Mizugakiibacter sp. TaxID=1972610 RepID=UPI0031C3B2E5|nr:DedA family protein [Xanthomonadaceae bacterium]
MRLFKPLYEMAMRWAVHPRAEPYLGGLSFVEAFIFPVAPELMLAPMTLAKPLRAWRYATISLAGSLLGALIGYALGHYAFDAVKPLFADLGWLPAIETWVGRLRADAAAHPWGVFLTLVLAGFVPVPLKIFTWASGIVGVPLLPFIASMAVGRGKRVYLLAALLRYGGRRAEQLLHQHIEWLGWAVLGALGLLGAWWFWLH